MPNDVTLIDIAEGVRTSWAAAGSAVTTTIPASKVYFKRAAEGTTYPFCTYEFDDVSAYFGGTEYYSGTKYQKTTRINLKLYGTRADITATYVRAVNDAFGWTAASPAVVWVIPNATVLSAMPEVEKMDLEPERFNAEDIIRYETSFTLKLEADRG